MSGVPSLHSCAVARLGPDITDEIASARPDVVLIDMGTPRGLELVQLIRRLLPEAKVVAFGVGDSEQEILACAEAGVAGYVCRDASTTELVDTVRSAARDELICSPRIAALFMRRVATLADRAVSSVDTLTVRERQVLGLIREGLGNKQIASSLNIAEATVKNHVHNLLEKLQVKRRAQAARIDGPHSIRRIG